MLAVRNFYGVCFLLGAVATTAAAQNRDSSLAATLRTSDTELLFRARDAEPLLTEIRVPGGWTWKNRRSEALPASVTVAWETVPVKWRLNAAASRTSLREVVFVYDSAAPRLRLVWSWQAREEFGPIEHEISIENLDREEVWLPLEDSVAFEFAMNDGARLENVFVEKGENAPSEVGVHRDVVSDGYRWTGESSTYASPAPGEAREVSPWMLVERADQVHEGFYVGIEFSARTRLSVARSGNSLRGVAGLNPEPGLFRTRLAPGETFRTPKIFLGTFSGGVDAAGNLLRRWERAILLSPKTLANPNYPMLVNNSWGSGMAVDEALALKMIHDSAELGLEMFHMDAGWFRTPGDWRPDAKKFPRGLVPIAEEAHSTGLRFGLWADWAQAGIGESAGALNVRDANVRDWLVNDLPDNWKPEEFKGQTIDFGAPAAADWAARETKRIVEEYKVDMLEHDGYVVAKGCDRADHPHAPPDSANLIRQNLSPWTWTKSSNSTDVSYRATNAYYAIQDKLRSEHPGLLLEVCNDGGRMVDFGSAAHADYFSITDAYDPLSNRRAFYDASHVLPPAMLETYVEKWPAPKLENFLYMLRSGMMGWLSVMQDTNAWTAEQHAAAKSEFEFYKRELRPLIRNADLYHISPRPDGIRWDAIEYFDARTERGAVYVFRGSSPGESKHRFSLKGLKANANYRLSFRGDSAAERIVPGGQLAKGLEVRLEVPLSSEIVLFEEAE